MEYWSMAINYWNIGIGIPKICIGSSIVDLYIWSLFRNASRDPLLGPYFLFSILSLLAPHLGWAQLILQVRLCHSCCSSLKMWSNSVTSGPLAPHLGGAQLQARHHHLRPVWLHPVRSELPGDEVRGYTPLVWTLWIECSLRVSPLHSINWRNEKLIRTIAYSLYFE